MSVERRCASCRREAQEGRSVCRRCRYAAEKARDPLRHSFLSHRRNARRRGIPWELTLEQFSEFAVRVDLLKRAGVSAHSYHIDRIREWEGYTVDNIQALTNSENATKSNAYRKLVKALAYDWQSGVGRYSLTVYGPPSEDDPF